MSYPQSEAGRPAEKSELLGQVVTPRKIAKRMARRLLSKRSPQPVTILDPCAGPITFPSAMAESGLLATGDRITAIDVDPEILFKAKQPVPILRETMRRSVGDYLELAMDNQYDYAILNPPYVRQEWLDKKEEYRETFRQRYGVDVPGTSNLYVYFLVKVISDLKPRGEFACILYDSWQSTLYGQWLSRFLDVNCDRLQVEIIAGQPFRNRLIDATILYGAKERLRHIKVVDHASESETQLAGPLAQIEGFRPISSVFAARRGLRLKQTSFFMCQLVDCECLGATPFLKKVSKLEHPYYVPQDHPEAALLATSHEPDAVLMDELERRIEEAQELPEENKSILNWFHERPEAWYLHRPAPQDPLVFNYYIRNRPRHIYNPRRGYSDNFYGLTPPDGVHHLAWLAALNSTAVCAEIMWHSHNQGAGLAKIQLFEYRRVAVPDLRKCSSSEESAFKSLGSKLVEEPKSAERTLREVDQLLAEVIRDPLLRPSRITEVFREADRQAKRPRSTP